MLIETVSAGLKLALLQGNSNQQTFRALGPLPCGNPFDQDLAQLVVNDLGVADGTHKAGFRGDLAQNRVKIVPFADQAGCAFSMRLWGWREVTQPGQSGQMLPVWDAEFLVEFACTSGTMGGVPNQGSTNTTNPYVLPDTAFTCDTMTLVQGQVGLTGLVNSTGPGTNLPAYGLVEILGCRFLTFDFQQTDQVGMNARWCFC